MLASLKEILLVLPTNIRLGFNGIPGPNSLAYSPRERESKLNYCTTFSSSQKGSSLTKSVSNFTLNFLIVLAPGVSVFTDFLLIT